MDGGAWSSVSKLKSTKVLRPIDRQIDERTKKRKDQSWSPWYHIASCRLQSRRASVVINSNKIRIQLPFLLKS